MRARLIFAAAFIAAVIGCTKEYKPDDTFMENDDIVLKIKGTELLKYDPMTFQLGYSPEKRQFRVSNDRMSEYYIVTCSSIPEKTDQKIKCSLKYAASSASGSKSDISFVVKKMDGNGVVWLWSSKDNIGVTVKILH